MDAYRDRDYYRQHLDKMRRRVAAEKLGGFFTQDFFDTIHRAIEGWNPEAGSLRMDVATFFMPFVRDHRRGRDLIGEVARRLQDLDSRTPKHKRVRQWAADLAKDYHDLMGALLQLFAVHPLVVPPNDLIAFEPKIGEGKRRAEVLARVAGCEVYVEATALTESELSLPAHGGAFCYLDEAERRDAGRVGRKVCGKASQYALADHPVVLFLSTNCLGYVLGGSVERGLGEVIADPRVCHGLSAIVVVDDWRCSGLRIHLVQGARHPLPELVRAWIEAHANDWTGGT